MIRRPGSGSGLLMLHGVSLAAAVWAPWLSAFTGYRVHLAGLYLADQRFGRNYDDMAPGLAQYVHDAIAANSRRLSG